MTSTTATGDDSDHNIFESTTKSGIDTPITDGSQEYEDDSSAPEKIIIGMVADTKDLFANFDADGNRFWSDKPPTDLEEAPENETTQKYAIIVRKKKPKRASSTKPLEIDSLIIQSPLLKNALGDILQDYPGITTDVTRLKFYAPFECFLHRWEEFEEATIDEHRDATTRQHLQLLYKILTDDLDGVRIGWVEKTIEITEFAGTKPLSKLSCYPLKDHPNRAVIEEELRQRGRRWEALRGYRYKAYNGIALSSTDKRTLSRERVNCRIVVDGARWEDENPNHLTHLETIHEADQSQADYEMPPLDDDHVLLTSPIVRGYTLKNKRWMQFFIDSVEEIEFHEGAFDSLVLSEELKKMILVLSHSQVKHKDSFDDVVKGKGRGIIMLLSGGPGIGKTLTAEVVAEQMRVPLYTMSAGDLGSSSDEVAENLGKVMSMVSDWNAVLLLDECDVFLEERTTADLERNRVVSIFLRALEYYEGILFLTTNRIASMDTAFQSRIHLTLEYPNLDTQARRAIWSNFLDRAASEGMAVKGDDFDEAALSMLSSIDLNGRQIQNVMKMAQLLAMLTGAVLTLRHVKTVLRIQGHMGQ
ncbi:hypothetical protein NHJ13051_009430 [Beauveria bassiana]